VGTKICCVNTEYNYNRREKWQQQKREMGTQTSRGSTKLDEASTYPQHLLMTVVVSSFYSRHFYVVANQVCSWLNQGAQQMGFPSFCFLLEDGSRIQLPKHDFICNLNNAKSPRKQFYRMSHLKWAKMSEEKNNFVCDSMTKLMECSIKEKRNLSTIRKLATSYVTY
jgi:hypothetical protein